MKVLAGLAAAGAAILAIPAIAVPMLLGVTAATVTCADPTPVTASLDGPSTPVERVAETGASDPEGVSGCASIFAATGTDPRLPAAPQQISAAVARELSYVGLRTGFAGKCDRLACRAFNYLNSGYASATAHWHTMLVSGHAHPGDRCPPTAAFVFWATSHSEGHVAFVVHADPGCDPHAIILVSNDVGDTATGAHGGVYLVTLAQIETGFVTAAGYRGWSDPICAGSLLPPRTRHPIPG